MTPEMTPELDFRTLTDDERQLIETLLAHDFPGRDQLFLQLEFATARRIFNDGTLELQTPGHPVAAVTRRVPVEGTCLDDDGKTIHILLHVKDGFLHELEILKADSSPIISSPKASKVVPWVEYGAVPRP